LDKKKVIRNLGRTAGVIAVTAGLAALMNLLKVGNESIILVFLLGVLFTAVLTSSRGWAIGDAVLSVMLFNFFYTVPLYTFLVYKPSDFVLLVFYLMTAIVAGTITSRLQAEIELSEKNEHTAVTLYKVTSAFLAESGEQQIVSRAEKAFREYAQVEAVVHLMKEDCGEAGNDGTKEEGISYPIESTSGKIGTVLIKGEKPDDQQNLIIRAVCTQLGTALEREKLVAEREEIRLAMEKERQRSMLLRSIGHDLRSPLTALSGAGNLLSDNYDTLTDAERQKLARDVSEESVWLTDLVENIMNMTRINESRLLLNKQNEVIDDVIAEAVKHTERLFQGRSIKVSLPDEVVAAPMDGKLIAQVIVNLLENAARHTPSDSSIEVRACVRDGCLEISVLDDGEGVPGEIRGRLFEKYVTMDTRIADGRKGLGLGLSICKAIVEAHGGKIRYEENRPKGSVFIFTIPMEAAS
jgi:two-component system sensor histidine kinase KdpD